MALMVNTTLNSNKQRHFFISNPDADDDQPSPPQSNGHVHNPPSSSAPTPDVQPRSSTSSSSHKTPFLSFSDSSRSSPTSHSSPDTPVSPNSLPQFPTQPLPASSEPTYVLATLDGGTIFKRVDVTTAPNGRAIRELVLAAVNIPDDDHDIVKLYRTDVRSQGAIGDELLDDELFRACLQAKDPSTSVLLVKYSHFPSVSHIAPLVPSTDTSTPQLGSDSVNDARSESVSAGGYEADDEPGPSRNRLRPLPSPAHQSRSLPMSGSSSNGSSQLPPPPAPRSDATAPSPRLRGRALPSIPGSRSQGPIAPTPLHIGDGWTAQAPLPSDISLAGSRIIRSTSSQGAHRPGPWAGAFSVEAQQQRPSPMSPPQPPPQPTRLSPTSASSSSSFTRHWGPPPSQRPPSPPKNRPPLQLPMLNNNRGSPVRSNNSVSPGSGSRVDNTYDSRTQLAVHHPSRYPGARPTPRLHGSKSTHNLAQRPPQLAPQLALSNRVAPTPPALYGSTSPTSSGSPVAQLGGHTTRWYPNPSPRSARRPSTAESPLSSQAAHLSRAPAMHVRPGTSGGRPSLSSDGGKIYMPTGRPTHHTSTSHTPYSIPYKPNVSHHTRTNGSPVGRPYGEDDLSRSVPTPHSPITFVGSSPRHHVPPNGMLPELPPTLSSPLFNEEGTYRPSQPVRTPVPTGPLSPPSVNGYHTPIASFPRRPISQVSDEDSSDDDESLWQRPLDDEASESGPRADEVIERPRPEEVYDRLDVFFPNHNLDAPMLDPSSSSPTSTEPPQSFPLEPTEQPKKRLTRHRMSIRDVADERKNKLKASKNGRRNTKMWDFKVEELREGAAVDEVPPVPELPRSTSEKPKFKWVKGELIGKGTYGRVYWALNANNGEMIAVKQVEMPKTSSDKRDTRQVSVVDALMAESNTLKQLDHPHIVQYLGLEQTEDHLSIFLEYVPGGSVLNYMRIHGKFSSDIVKSFTNQILDGLKYLHSMKVLHRDLKADNILVDRQGICKISDFGISRSTDDAYNDFTGTALKGSIFWMAPEMLSEDKQYSAKIDIWSLGCVVLEMWAGRRPWEEQNLFSTMMALNQKQAPPVPPDVVIDAVAEDFRQKCFAVDPKDRPTAAVLFQHPYHQLPEGWVFPGFPKVPKKTPSIRHAR